MMLRSSKQGFTLTEIMMVVGVIGILVGISVPGFVKAREKAQANACLEAQQKMDGAVDCYAIDNGKQSGAKISDPSTLIGRTQYVKTWPRCPVSANSSAIFTRIQIPPIGSSSVCPNELPAHRRAI